MIEEERESEVSRWRSDASNVQSLNGDGDRDKSFGTTRYSSTGSEFNINSSKPLIPFEKKILIFAKEENMKMLLPLIAYLGLNVFVMDGFIQTFIKYLAE
jgi:hypothetical protein